MNGWRERHCAALTLLEVLIVIAVIAISATLLVPAVLKLRERAQRVQCMSNLKSLYVAAEAYLQQNGSWPQIHLLDDSDTSEMDYANAWIAAIEPFGPNRKTWICPTIQEANGNPDYLKTENARVDYMAMQFDDKPTTPHQWPRQPWFYETKNAHGNGNLIIFTDGSISDLNTVAKQAAGK